MTQCSSREVRFRGRGRKEVVGRFDGGDITGDAGGLLLSAVDRRIRLIDRFASCFKDFRDPGRIEHPVRDLVAQRIYALALGYEDLNDHDELRSDPMLAMMVGKKDPKGRGRVRARDEGRALAGSSTLNRLELGDSQTAGDDRYKRLALDPEAVDRLLVDLFLESKKRAPKQITLDLDATDDPLHGRQEGRFFHGYYNCYCYLPLYIFSGDHLLCARLRESNIDPAAGSVEELERIVSQIRGAWPKTRILIRADSGFCRDWLMAWCEENGVDYLLGVARNARLEDKLEPHLHHAERLCGSLGRKAALYTSFRWCTRDSWCRWRRVIGKAEWSHQGPNPRFVVTSLPCKDSKAAKRIYREIYCKRGDMENRIKEQQLYLFADRTSSHTMQANQIRLYFSSMAYTLLEALRRFGLAKTELARAQCHTIRLKLLKIGARIKVTARRIWLHMAEGYPYQTLFFRVWNLVRQT